MSIVFSAFILFYGLLFWYADYENSKVELRNSSRKQNSQYRDSTMHQDSPIRSKSGAWSIYKKTG